MRFFDISCFGYLGCFFQPFGRLPAFLLIFPICRAPVRCKQSIRNCACAGEFGCLRPFRFRDLFAHTNKNCVFHSQAAFLSRNIQPIFFTEILRCRYTHIYVHIKTYVSMTLKHCIGSKCRAHAATASILTSLALCTGDMPTQPANTKNYRRICPLLTNFHDLGRKTKKTHESNRHTKNIKIGSIGSVGRTDRSDFF